MSKKFLTQIRPPNGAVKLGNVLKKNIVFLSAFFDKNYLKNKNYYLEHGGATMTNVTCYR